MASYRSGLSISTDKCSCYRRQYFDRQSPLPLHPFVLFSGVGEPPLTKLITRHLALTQAEILRSVSTLAVAGVVAGDSTILTTDSFPSGHFLASQCLNFVYDHYLPLVVLNQS